MTPAASSPSSAITSRCRPSACCDGDVGPVCCDHRVTAYCRERQAMQITITSVFVDDQQLALAFYTEVLGMKTLERRPQLVHVSIDERIAVIPLGLRHAGDKIDLLMISI